MNKPMDGIIQGIDITRANPVLFTNGGVRKLVGPVIENHSGLQASEVGLIFTEWQVKPELIFVLQ